MNNNYPKKIADTRIVKSFDSSILDENVTQLAERYPFAKVFFDDKEINFPASKQSIRNWVRSLDDFQLLELGMSRDELATDFIEFMNRMLEIKEGHSEDIESITIIGGHDKSSNPENLSLTVHTGEIICIVGPTGSGKSRLLEDIEYLAQGDTPTGRRVLVNNTEPSYAIRNDIEKRIVAELSQSMNFIMDLTVEEFLCLHAKSRMVESDYIKQLICKVLKCANDLTGEQFNANTPITMLSGGQSRALMIADIALISRSPVVLIDEIENAGVDRSKALNVLLNNDKIVFVVTHDPLIALMGNRRVIIANGGISDVLEREEQEQLNLEVLSQLDAKIMHLRQLVRSGAHINSDLNTFFREG